MLGNCLILLAMLADSTSIELRLPWRLAGAPPAAVRVEGGAGYVSMQLPEGWDAGDRETFELYIDGAAIRRELPTIVQGKNRLGLLVFGAAEKEELTSLVDWPTGPPRPGQSRIVGRDDWKLVEEGERARGVLQLHVVAGRDEFLLAAAADLEHAYVVVTGDLRSKAPLDEVVGILRSMRAHPPSR